MLSSSPNVRFRAAAPVPQLHRARRASQGPARDRDGDPHNPVIAHIAPGLAQAEVAGHRIGPDTVDGIAPAGDWSQWWRDVAQAKRAGAPWARAADEPPPEPAASAAAPAQPGVAA